MEQTAADRDLSNFKTVTKYLKDHINEVNTMKSYDEIAGFVEKMLADSTISVSGEKKNEIKKILKENYERKGVSGAQGYLYNLLLKGSGLGVVSEIADEIIKTAANKNRISVYIDLDNEKDYKDVKKDVDKALKDLKIKGSVKVY